MRRDKIDDLVKVDLDTATEIIESGLYNITDKNLMYSNKPLRDLLNDNLNGSEVFLEIINTGEISIQILHTTTFEMRRSGIKQKFNWTWSDWGKTYTVTKEKLDPISEEKPIVEGWSYSELKEVLREYIRHIKGASYVDMDKGKQPAYNDLDVKAKINALVDKSRRVEIVPHNAQQMETLS